MHIYRIEMIDIQDGSQQTPILTTEEFNRRYNKCLMYEDMTEEQIKTWGISNNNSGACKYDDDHWLVVANQDDLETFYNHKLYLYSNNGDLINQTEEATLCGGSANGVPLMTYENRQLTCARISANCGGVTTWRIFNDISEIRLNKIQDNMELRVD